MFSTLMKHASGAVLTAGLVIGSIGTANAVVMADIVWLIDTSGSMDDDITEIKTRITEFNTEMIANSIDAHYGLVEFGGTSGSGNTNGTAAVRTDIADFTSFIASSGWTGLSALVGGDEKGSLAVSTALGGMTFRTDSVINVILVTDEDDDSSGSEFSTADTDLGNYDALFNFIGCPLTGSCPAGIGNNTEERYKVLADNHGGTNFLITDFRSDPDPFFAAFIDTKVEEIITASNDIPEPNTIALLGLGLLGLGYVRRRNSA